MNGNLFSGYLKIEMTINCMQIEMILERLDEEHKDGSIKMKAIQ